MCIFAESVWDLQLDLQWCSCIIQQVVLPPNGEKKVKGENLCKVRSYLMCPSKLWDCSFLSAKLKIF